MNLDNINNSSDLFVFEINSELKYLLKILALSRSESRITKALQSIKKSGYGDEVSKMLEVYIDKYLEIKNPDIGPLNSIGKSKMFLEDGEIDDKIMYESSGKIVGKYIGLNFLNNALWSLVIEKLDGGKEIIPMDILAKGVEIRELNDRELKKYKSDLVKKVSSNKVDYILQIKP